MRFARIGLCLSAMLLLMLFAIQLECSAQSFGDAFSSQAAFEDDAIKKDGTTERRPILQGSGCGTIGPQGEEATSIMGVNTAPQEQETPVVPAFLASMLVLSVAAYGLRRMAVQKRAPLWVLGTVAAGLVALAGFMWTTLIH